jgi:hypothetical protein
MILLLSLIIQSQISWSLPYQLDIHVVDLETSGWNKDLFEPEFQSLREVYSQCGIDVRLVDYQKANGFTGLKKYDFKSEDSIAALAKATANVPRPAVYLIQDLIDGNQTPFSRAHFEGIQDEYPEALLDTVWYPVFVSSSEYKKSREASPYSALAHELFHIITRWGEHNNDEEPNLMTIYRRRNNRIPLAMCARAVTHPAIKGQLISFLHGMNFEKPFLF